MTYPEGEPDKARPCRFRCHSWRHAGECCEWKAAQDYNRIAEAVQNGKDWVFCVLTFAQSEWWDWMEQYRLSYRYWSKLRCRLRREYGSIRYIQTWERHKSKGIHVNLLIDNNLLARDCYQSYDKRDKKDRWHNDTLRDHAVACGFGPIHWAEPLRDGTGDKMSGYLVKCAKELVGAGGKGQIPYDAPPHFRRLRASRGVLPPVHSSGYSGYLVLKPYPEWVSAEKGETWTED